MAVHILLHLQPSPTTVYNSNLYTHKTNTVMPPMKISLSEVMVSLLRADNHPKLNFGSDDDGLSSPKYLEWLSC